MATYRTQPVPPIDPPGDSAPSTPAEGAPTASDLPTIPRALPAPEDDAASWPSVSQLPAVPPPAPEPPSPESLAPTAPRHALPTRPIPGRSARPDAYQPTQRSPGASPETVQIDRATRPVGRRILTGKLLANKYEIGTRLGVGGMGEVYRASHLTLGVQVAVKIMHPHVAAVDEYARRFRREAHAASLLQHRNVVRVIDFGEEDDILYIVMELLRGETVSRWLSRSPGPSPIAACVDILTQVLDAFEAAHAIGIVHRDLKPDNVFLADEDDGKRIAKVVDFGLAHVDDHRDTGPTLTNHDIVSGTPEYMSPEQCRSLVVGPSTDIYAIGCLLTDMLQLRPPFTGTPVEVMTQQMFVPPPALKRPPDAEPVPPLLERLRLALLAKSPDQRPPSIREVRRLLLEAVSPEAAAQRLPARKTEPVSGRGEAGRAPLLTGPTGAATAPLTATLIRLTQREDGLSSSCATGLAAQSIHLEETDTKTPPAGQIILLDTGDDVDAAAGWLRAASARVPVIVCLDGVTTDRMNTLIAAGAKDIIPYPVTSDVVAKKARRAARSR